MSVFVFAEKPQDSRRQTVNPPTLEVSYIASGEFDMYAMKAQVMNLVPSAFATAEGLLWLQDVAFATRGHKLFDVVATYAPTRQIGSARFAFSTTGGSFHLTHSYATVATYGSSGGHQQAIGVRKSGSEYEIDGADVIIPALKTSYTFRHPQGQINEAFAVGIALLTGCVNAAPWKGYAAGEVLFLGGNGADGTDAEAEVTYDFASEPNLSGLIFGAISGVAKQGHDLLWVEWKDNVVSGQPTKAVKAVHIERIYRRVDFNSVFGF
jgi:hypothetical protein